DGRGGRQRVPPTLPRLERREAADAALDPHHHERRGRQRAGGRAPHQGPEGGREEVRAQGLQERPRRARFQPHRHETGEGVAGGGVPLPGEVPEPAQSAFAVAVATSGPLVAATTSGPLVATNQRPQTVSAVWSPAVVAKPAGRLKPGLATAICNWPLRTRSRPFTTWPRRDPESMVMSITTVAPRGGPAMLSSPDSTLTPSLRVSQRAPRITICVRASRPDSTEPPAS